jgi:hypothetical protein
VNVKGGAGLAGLIILGLSPSYQDWKQSPDRHGEFLAYYAVAIALVYWGIIRP